MSKLVLLSRERSSMVSSWGEHLCLDERRNGRMRLSTCRPEWLGSIYELVPEDELYDEHGELRVPDAWEGQAIVGLGDGEYLQTENLVEDTVSDEFGAESLGVARMYCDKNNWTEHPDFANAWHAVEAAAEGPANAGRRQ